MKIAVPTTTTPLAKFIRTGEGILVYAANLALILVPILTSSLSAAQAVKYGVILDTAAVIARSLLKALATKTPTPLAGTPVRVNFASGGTVPAPAPQPPAATA